MANIPAGANTNQVTLGSLSFSSAARVFTSTAARIQPSCWDRLERGNRLAIHDSGPTAILQGPPDYNYDHANFYWRLELQPAESVDIFSATTVGNSTLNMLANEYTGATVRIANGTGAGQERTIALNSATTITTTTNWGIVPDATSTFVVADSTWQFGATSNASPVSFSVPNREGVTIQISGRAANVLDKRAHSSCRPLPTGEFPDQRAIMWTPMFRVYQRSDYPWPARGRWRFRASGLPVWTTPALSAPAP